MPAKNHEKIPKQYHPPYEVYRLGSGEELAAICGFVATMAASNPGCEVRRPHYPPRHAPRLAMFRPADITKTGTELPWRFLNRESVQEAILEDVPSLQENLDVNAVEFNIFTPNNKKYALGRLKLSDKDNEAFIREQFAIRRVIGRLLGLDSSAIDKTPVYNPKIQVLRVPRKAMPRDKLNDLKERVEEELLPAPLIMRKASLPEIILAGATMDSRPTKRPQQTAEDLEKMIAISRRTPIYQQKPKQRGL